jgi:ABC-2 type transport system permease protein
MEKTTTLGPGHRAAPGVVQIGVIAWYTLIDYVRSRRFVILLAIVFGLCAILILIFGNVLFELEQLAPSVALFCGIFFGSDAIAGEFQNKTGYFSIPNPIRRSSIYMGKWVAAYVGSSFILAIFTAVMVGLGFAYADLPSQFGLSIVFTWVFLAAELGCVFFISSISKSMLISVFLDLMLLLWASMVMQDFAGLIPVEPWFLLTYGGQIIASILITPYPPHKMIGPNAFFYKGIGGAMATVFTPTIPEGLIIMGVYFIITMVLGLLIFERKEL